MTWLSECCLAALSLVKGSTSLSGLFIVLKPVQKVEPGGRVIVTEAGQHCRPNSCDVSEGRELQQLCGIRCPTPVRRRWRGLVRERSGMLHDGPCKN